MRRSTPFSDEETKQEQICVACACSTEVEFSRGPARTLGIIKPFFKEVVGLYIHAVFLLCISSPKDIASSSSDQFHHISYGSSVLHGRFTRDLFVGDPRFHLLLGMQRQAFCPSVNESKN